MSDLSEDQLALLHTYLRVPIAVGDVLYNHLDVDDEIEYALHEMLSEIDCDSALLAIAVSAKHIALRYANDIPVAAALSFETSKLIDEYGPEWLDRYNDGPIDEDLMHQMLRHLPEDLEAIADLLDALRVALVDREDPTCLLCTVLSIQARAHMEIADYILEEIERDQADEFAISELAAGPPGDNIILFPIHLRQPQKHRH